MGLSLLSWDRRHPVLSRVSRRRSNTVNLSEAMCGSQSQSLWCRMLEVISEIRSFSMLAADQIRRQNDFVETCFAVSARGVKSPARTTYIACK